MYKRDGPKLPYQAVVIRQSAMHLKAGNAIVGQGGVDPHTEFRADPRFRLQWL